MEYYSLNYETGVQLPKRRSNIPRTWQQLTKLTTNQETIDPKSVCFIQFKFGLEFRFPPQVVESHHRKNQKHTKMGIGPSLVCVTMFWMLIIGGEGIRFVIDREECLSHNVEYEGDTVHVSFVVIKTDSIWHFSDDGVDLVIKGPNGEQVHDLRGKTSEKHEFVAQKKGLYRFCLTNKSPYHETIDFDVQVGHFSFYDQHAKDEHFKPLLEQISKLEEALYNIQFEQHWLEAETDRQAIVNEAMSRRAVHKAIFESAALVGASVLQVYLLQRLFERKLGTSRV